MFHPTIFENLKVAFENRIYDLDSLDGKIDILNRIDRMDFAIMKRDFALRFALLGEPDVTVEVVLEASLQELADEILENERAHPGSALRLRFRKRVEDSEKTCKKITEALAAIWEDDVEIKQTLSRELDDKKVGELDTILVKFKPKLDEEHIEEIPEFLEHVLESLAALNKL
ncbi:hypothetical protein QR721_03035 [Aciduricibacillus chroicocephali]|uniref:Uncharacterized protein n=1 Tax=Aciduricibacillus chroicocephali TaxID=3054939 RepID=A0ABY9KWF9_9BACI|nr:hypothetical protein QR721_03035 [Bacillaceae bacterium 44XB]